MADCEIRATVRRTCPRIPFCGMTHRILGKNYDISVALVGDSLSRRINRERRSIDKPTNVLAFPISKNEGEIIINLPKAMREAKAYSTTVKRHIGYLFIHGALHLKGMRHGATMEKRESELLHAFFGR